MEPNQKQVYMPKSQKGHGGGEMKNLLYAQTKLRAWWSEANVHKICPNPNLTWWKILKKTPNIPALKTCNAKLQRIIKNK